MAIPDEPGITSLSELFIKSDGSSRSREDAIKSFGHRAVWVAELNQALEARLAGPPPLSVPPRIFVSYRWAGDAENEWVAKLVSALRERGYLVVFDRTDKPEDLPVPEFVSRIADCHWFLAVLDPGYKARIGSAEDESGAIQDGWVFDEYNTAAFLSNAGRMHILGFLRKGDELPRGFRFPVPGRLGNAVEVRDPNEQAKILDQIFPPFAGAPPQSKLVTAWELIRASHQAAREGRMDTAFALAQRAAAACPEIMDGHAQLARAAVLLSRSAEGLEAARQALAIQPDSIEMMQCAAGCAYHMLQPGVAAQYCVAILERDEGERTRRFMPVAHYYLGNVQDDSGQCYAGIAHLEIARRLRPDVPSQHNDTGLAYRHVDEVEKALACFADGLKLTPDDIGLLVNQAAAFIEAGKASQSRMTLKRLAEIEPDHPAIKRLTQILDAWQTEGGPPPRLVPRIAPRTPTGVTSCTKCPVKIPLADEKVMLCAGCGAEREQLGGRCEVCNHDGIVPVAMAALGFVAMMCPYCRDGSLQFAAVA